MAAIRDRRVEPQEREHKGVSALKTLAHAKPMSPRSEEPIAADLAKLKQEFLSRLARAEPDLLVEQELSDAVDLALGKAWESQRSLVRLSGKELACRLSALLDAYEQAARSAVSTSAASPLKQADLFAPLELMAYRLASLSVEQIQGLMEGVAQHLGARFSPSTVVDMLAPKSITIVMCTREGDSLCKAQAVIAGCRAGLKPAHGLLARLHGRDVGTIAAALAKAAAQAARQCDGRVKANELLAPMTSGKGAGKPASKGDAKTS